MLSILPDLSSCFYPEPGDTYPSYRWRKILFVPQKPSLYTQYALVCDSPVDVPQTRMNCRLHADNVCSGGLFLAANRLSRWLIPDVEDTGFPSPLLSPSQGPP